jgi:hypothetical protein
MKKPDEATIKMLENELNRLMDEVTADSSIAEQNLVIIAILEVTVNTMGLPNVARRKVFEVLYRYYALIEGLEKK